MIEYIIRSAVCLALLLAVYLLFFETERTHKFNRFFLLFALCFSFLIPLCTITVYPEAAPATETFNADVARISSEAGVAHLTPASNRKNYFIPALVFCYFVTMLYFLVGFLFNIYTILAKVKSCQKVPYKGAILVLVQEQIICHTFLNYIFINESQYRSHSVERELLEHELTHVQQKHTLDILFAELIHVAFWFNPIMIFYKKAIRLNHEFLADRKVLTLFNDVQQYQNLLLSKTGIITTAIK